MINKTARLTEALKQETIRRLPIIVAVTILVFFGQFLLLNFKTAEGVEIVKRNNDNSQALLRHVAELSEDNKELAAQNNRLALENAAHIDCIAKVFARYTRDQQPVTITNLDTCRVERNGAFTISQSPPEAQPNASANNNTNQPTNQNGNTTTQPNNGGSGGSGGGGTGGGTDDPEPVEVLGIPVCLPLTNVCVRS